MSNQSKGDSSTSSLIRAQARRLLREEGIDALSVRRVAKEAAVGMGTLRYHFPARADLLEACLDEYHTRLVELQQEEIARILASPNPQSAVLEAVVRIFDFVRANAEMQRLADFTTTDSSEIPESRRTRYRAPFFNASSELLLEVGRSGVGDLRLVIASTTRLVTWYASRSDAELMHLSGQSSSELAEQAIRAHLVAMAKQLVF